MIMTIIFIGLIIFGCVGLTYGDKFSKSISLATIIISSIGLAGLILD